MRRVHQITKALVCVSIFTLILAGSGSLAIAQDKPVGSLYDRLGGIYPIATVVDTFIDLLLVNDELNTNPAIKEARDRVPTPGLKFHVTALVCQQTGGPCRYTGRTMKSSHAHLNITEGQWQVMLGDFRRALNNYNIPEQEQKDLFAIVESTKGEIVIPARK